MSKGAEVEPNSSLRFHIVQANGLMIWVDGWWLGDIFRRFGTSWGILGHLGTVCEESPFFWESGKTMLHPLAPAAARNSSFFYFWSELVKTGNLYLMHQKPCSSYAGEKKTVIWVICNLPWLIFHLLMGCVCCIACFQSLPAIKHGNGASENPLQYCIFLHLCPRETGFVPPKKNGSVFQPCSQDHLPSQPGHRQDCPVVSPFHGKPNPKSSKIYEAHGPSQPSCWMFVLVYKSLFAIIMHAYSYMPVNLLLGKHRVPQVQSLCHGLPFAWALY